MRKTVPGYKTEVVFSHDDVQLIICPRGQARYYPYHVTDLPPIDMTPLRSPPPGRARHKRTRSGSLSPQVERKSSRHNSPTKSSATDVEVVDNTTNQSVHNVDPTAEEHGNENPADVVTASPETNIPPIRSSMPQFLDLGEYSNMQIASPLTGKVSFDFKEPVNLRRQSLNF